MAWWDYRPICEPTASADAAVVKRSESPRIAAAGGALAQGASKALNASVRGRVPVFEHREAVPTPCGGGPLARLLIRPPQPTPNGRTRGCRVRLAAGRANRTSPGSRRIRGIRSRLATEFRWDLKV